MVEHLTSYKLFLAKREVKKTNQRLSHGESSQRNACNTGDGPERNNIYDSIRPVVYSQYVDDIGTVVSSIPEASQLLETLNSQHDTINSNLSSRQLTATCHCWTQL